MERKTSDLTKQDWVDINREGGWNGAFDQQTYKSYCEVKTFDELLFSEYNASVAESLSLRFCLLEFIEKKKLNVVRIGDPSHDGEYAPTFANIEYEPKKFKSCLYNGCYFIKSNDDTKYIIAVEPVHEGFVFKIISCKNSKTNADELLKEFIEYAKVNSYLKGKKIDASCNFIYLDKDYTWDDLILPDNIKDDVRQNLTNLIESEEIYKKNNLPLKRGLIFQGLPGTGKSLLGKILCRTVDWTFIWVTPKFLARTDSPSIIVKTARILAPTILFLEDLDLYGGNREEHSHKGLLGELLNQLDGIEENNGVVTIATTNNAKVLEKALLDRPGRFDKVITFNPPTEECRAKMLKHFLNDVQFDDDVNFNFLVKEMGGFTGAQVREVVNLAVLYAIDEKAYGNDKKLKLTKLHFERALKSAKKKDFTKAIGFGLSTGTRATLYDDY